MLRSKPRHAFARRFEGQPTKDDIVITTGSEIGGLLVDGLGDGVLVEAPQLPTTELNFLRTMSFGLLQVRDFVSHLQLILNDVRKANAKLTQKHHLHIFLRRPAWVSE